MMNRLTLTETQYLRPGEAFHFARRALEHGPVNVLHDHDYFELFWIAGGRVAHLINGVEIRLEAGDGALIRPRDGHGFSPLGTEPCRLVNVMFRSETAAHLGLRYGDEFAGRYFWTEAATPYGFHLDLAQQGRLERWAADLESGARSLARIESFLIRVLTQLIPAALESRPEVPPWLAAAVEAARRPEVFRMGAQGLIAAAGRTHEHVCRGLKTLMGLTPSALINQMRMEHAARLLRDTDLSASDIAVECGLENMSHFHSLFRRQFDMTPRRYRIAHQRDPVQPDAGRFAIGGERPGG